MSTGNWIDCDVKLPDSAATVLVNLDDGWDCFPWDLAYYDGFSFVSMTSKDLSRKLHTVTHWMPIPTPPPRESKTGLETMDKRYSQWLEDQYGSQ